MTLKKHISGTEKEASLEKNLHQFRDDLSAARVAAMQVLIFHMQAGSQDAQDIPPDEFMQAGRDLKVAHSSLVDLDVKYLSALGITLPDALKEIVTQNTRDLGELVRIVDRCRAGDDGKIKGFQPATDMYNLCCSRVAKGLNSLSGAMASHFLELSDKQQADTSDKTSTIAMEIGKIGRVINMVATNASIEAARAGDAGKGFTVIADEVKTLSSRVSSLSVSLTERLS